MAVFFGAPRNRGRYGLWAVGWGPAKCVRTVGTFAGFGGNMGKCKSSATSPTPVKKKHFLTKISVQKYDMYSTGPPLPRNQLIYFSLI